MTMAITYKRARGLAVQYAGARGQMADAIAAHMVATGDCVWHAVFEIRGRTGTCGCQDCTVEVAS